MKEDLWERVRGLDKIIGRLVRNLNRLYDIIGQT